MIKDIDENYSISDSGEVYSRPRPGTRGGRLKLVLSCTGYYVVVLSPSRRPTKVHRLVANAFLENPLNLPAVNHKDGNKTNNSVENLEWCDHKSNHTHAVTNGLIELIPCVGVENFSAKLTEEDVLFIRKNYRAFHKIFGSTSLGKKFGVHRKTIEKIVSRETWNHL